MEIKVTKAFPEAKLPTYGSKYAAGMDLYAHLDEKSTIIPPHCTAKISTGFSMAIPDGYFGAVFARSGLATKQGLRPANCVGVIDSDYRGVVMVALHNDTEVSRVVNNGYRIAQLVILPCMQAELVETESLDETERGEGGFGSTGTK